MVSLVGFDSIKHYQFNVMVEKFQDFFEFPGPPGKGS